MQLMEMTKYGVFSFNTLASGDFSVLLILRFMTFFVIPLYMSAITYLARSGFWDKASSILDFSPSCDKLSLLGICTISSGKSVVNCSVMYL